MAKTLLASFGAALFVLVFLFFMIHFIKLFNMAVFYGADMLWVFSTMGKLLPDVFSLCAPMAFQLGVLLTLATMSENGEVMALRAAGFSFKEITKPIFIIAIALSAVLFVFSNYITPKTTKDFLDARANIGGRIAKVVLEPKTFMEIGNWSLYADTITDNEVMTQVHLVSQDDKGSLSTKINALTGKVTLTNDYVFLQLFDGQMQRVSAQDQREIIAANFKKYRVTFPLTRQVSRRQRPTEFTTPGLFKLISEGEIAKDKVPEYKTEISMRQVMAFSPIILVFVSCPLVFSFGKKKTKAWGMLWSLVIILGFYGLMTAGVSLGKKQELVSYIAPFLPMVIGAGAGYYLWKTRLKR
ncbi:lipopolysaccharide export LptBFGC system permease protein LptF [Elusimicrobium posterum]|uniref:LptF/LptG family permease n=1 Tax=Elusimicrobium posterum TaxID=3116653 RepID=UPI003C78E2A8